MFRRLAHSVAVRSCGIRAGRTAPFSAGADRLSDRTSVLTAAIQSAGSDPAVEKLEATGDTGVIDCNSPSQRWAPLIGMIQVHRLHKNKSY